MQIYLPSRAALHPFMILQSQYESLSRKQLYEQVKYKLWWATGC